MNPAFQYDSEFSIPYHYRIFFTENVFASDNTTLLNVLTHNRTEPSKVFFIMERELDSIFPELKEEIVRYCEVYASGLHRMAPVFLADGGERCKNLNFAEKLCGEFLKYGLCRQSCVVMIGGGALLDAAGFAAGIFHRGIRQIRIPTTALAQCDSGVGVKNAVNAFQKKNLLGTFAPPKAVINDKAFLRTLPETAIAGAAAEALKVATIKDADFLDWLGVHAPAIMMEDFNALETMIRRSALLHVRHIQTSGDPFEYGSARPLDFGHWSAHKIEMLSNGRISHGEAVGMGILLDALYAARKGITPVKTFNRLREYANLFHLPFHQAVFNLRNEDGKRAVLDGIVEFREHLGGTLHITLPGEIPGTKVEVTKLDEALLEQVIQELCSIQKTEE